MTEPRISVVVPSLNQGRFIRETLTSIVTQDYHSYEVIVVDGGSDDETLEILRSFGGRIEWSSEPDAGQSNAINKGMRKATGDIVCWLNSDDLFEPGALRTVAHFFASNLEADLAFGRCRVIDENGNACRSFVDLYKTWWARAWSARCTLLLLNYIPQPAAFWRRSAMERIGELDESLYYAMDYDLWLRLSALSPPRFIDQYLARFRVHADSKSLRGANELLSEGRGVARRRGASGAAFLVHAIQDTMTLSLYKAFYSRRT